MVYSSPKSAALGAKRNALLLTAKTSFTSSVYMVTLAVRPGFSFSWGLAAEITTSYVTTLLVVVGSWRTCVTYPSNSSLGKASTV